MKRKLSLLVAILSIAFTLDVSAATTSGVQPGPGLTPGTFTATPAYALTTTKSNKTVTGPDTSVIFSGYSILPKGLMDNNNRKMTVILMEEDQYPNEDDKVKTYVWTFQNKIMKNVTITTNDYGNIDSAGDPTVELYLNTYLEAVDGDSIINTGRIFWYEIKVE